MDIVLISMAAFLIGFIFGIAVLIIVLQMYMQDKFEEIKEMLAKQEDFDLFEDV